MNPLFPERASLQMVSLIFDDINAVPLGDEPLLLNGSIIGKTTPAAFGFRMGKPIAIAFVYKQLEVGGTDELTVNVAGTNHRDRLNHLRFRHHEIQRTKHYISTVL